MKLRVNAKRQLLNNTSMRWILALLFVFGCRSKDDTASRHAPEFFRFRLSPGLNTEYRYAFTSETEMEQEVNNQNFDNTNKLEIQTVYSFSKDTNSTYKLRMVYEKFRVSIKAMDQEKDLDASTAGSSLLASDKMFAAFNNAIIIAAVDSLGNTTNFSGIEAIKGQMNEYAGDDAEARQMLNGSIKQYITEQFFKQSIETSLKALTTKTIKPGDTIMATTPVGGELNISASVIYKLVSIKQGVANITVDANVDLKDQLLAIENTTVRASLKGKQEGEIKINVQTGLLQQSDITLNMKGTMQIMGTEVPFKMKTKNSVKLLN